MRAMKDSGIEWIGNIPCSWDLKRIKAVLKERNEINRPAKTDFILSLTNDRGVIPYEQKGDIGNKSKDNIEDYKVAYKNDIVLNSMNVIIGSVGLSKYHGCVSPVYYMLYIRNKEDDIRFYNYLFQSRELQNRLKGYGNGIMEIRMRIQMSKLNTVNIPVAPAAEQHKIADYLDAKCLRIDFIVNKELEVIAKLQEYKLSLITEKVTKGLNPNVEMKDSGIEWIGEIPKDCKVTRVGHLYNIVLGKMLSPKQKDKSETLEKYLCAINVHFSGINYDTIKYMWFSENDKILYRLEKGDLLVVEGGAGAAGAAILEEDIPNCYIQNSLMIVRSKGTAINRILYYTLYMLVNMGYVDFVCNKATIPHFTKDKLSNMPIVIFGDKQQEIIDYLDTKCAAIDAAIAKKQALIEKFTEYKKSLIYEVVTGKKEV